MDLACPGATTRQIFAFHAGDRSGQSAHALWVKIPAVIGRVFVLHGSLYGLLTNHVERFNCKLRQRLSRLMRATLSFSKKLSNHIGAIKYFICDYNLTKCAALPE
jgi:insertion element IS1 protein InsB